jgi:hypothetical protein
MSTEANPSSSNEKAILPAKQYVFDAPWQILAADLDRPEVQDALQDWRRPPSQRPGGPRDRANVLAPEKDARIRWCWLGAKIQRFLEWLSRQRFNNYLSRDRVPPSLRCGEFIWERGVRSREEPRRHQLVKASEIMLSFVIASPQSPSSPVRAGSPALLA